VKVLFLSLAASKDLATHLGFQYYLNLFPQTHISMPVTQRAASSSTLFGAAPFQTYAPTQGSITLYKDDSCSSPLSDSATPLIEAQCQNIPFPDIRAVSINSLPACDNYGTPILVFSDQADCKNSTDGAVGDGGVVDSMQFICYGSGISAVSTAAASSSEVMISVAPSASGSQSQSGTGIGLPAATTTIFTDSGQEEKHGSGNSCECCCCCTVM
jgi:hypothetical protein